MRSSDNNAFYIADSYHDFMIAVETIRVPGGGYLIMPDGIKKFFSNGVWTEQEFNKYITSVLEEADQTDISPKLYDGYNRKDGKAF